MLPVETFKQRMYLGVAIAFAILPGIAVFLRIYARRMRLAVTDYCIVAALLCVWGICACGILNVLLGGTGMHQKDVSVDHFKIYLESLFAIEIMWAVAGGLVKTSMCLFFMEIFHTRAFRIAAYAVIVFSVMFTIGSSLGSVFLCLPVKASIDPTVQGKCGNRNLAWVLQGVFNIMTDLSVVLLPMPEVWKLQLPLHKKIGIVVVFSLGLFVCVISGIRLKYLLAVDFLGDMSYTVTETMAWSVMEASLAVTVGCLPALAALFTRVAKKPSWSPSASSGGKKRSDRTHGFWTSRLNRVNGGDTGIGNTLGETQDEHVDGTPLTSYKAASQTSLCPIRQSMTEPEFIHVEKDWRITRAQV